MNYIDRLKCEVHLVEHCNLNCKGCYHFSPLAKEEFLSINEWERDCGRLSLLFGDKMDYISLMGGEPLLHPDICEFMRITRENFPTGGIWLITNAILLPNMKEDFWEACRKYNIVIRPTKYPINLDFDSIEKKAGMEQVDFQYFNGGIMEMTLGKQPIDLEGKQAIEDNFQNCYRANNCVAFSHGKLYSCLIPAHLHHFKNYFKLLISDCKDDGIDIYKARSAEEIMDKMKKPLEACKYCDRNHILRNGLSWEVSKRDIQEWIQVLK